MSEPNNNQKPTHRRVPRLPQSAIETSTSKKGFVPATESIKSVAPTARPASPKKKLGAAGIVFRISALVFACCLVALAFIGFNYWQGQNKYEGVSRDYFPAQDLSMHSLDEIHLNWESLRAINPETVAWIYIPGTVVNYPIVHTTDNNKYIKTDYQGETNRAVSYGAIFLHCECEADMSCQNNFFFGHNMNNGAMFNFLTTLDDDKVFNENRTVYLFTPQGNYRLTTFALLHVGAYDDLVQPNVGTAAEETAYLQEQMNRSVVTPSGSLPPVSSIDKTFVFVTCDNLPSDGRYALYCYVADTTVPQVNKLGEGSAVSALDVQAIDDNAALTAAGEDTNPGDAY